MINVTNCTNVNVNFCHLYYNTINVKNGSNRCFAYVRADNDRDVDKECKGFLKKSLLFAQKACQALHSYVDFCREDSIRMLYHTTL